MEGQGGTLIWQKAHGELKVQKRGRRRKAQAAPTLQESNACRARMLVQERHLSRAARALVSLGLDVDSGEALQEMWSKHLEATPPVLPDEPLTVNSEQVGETIKSSQPGSGTGGGLQPWGHSPGLSTP